MVISSKVPVPAVVQLEEVADPPRAPLSLIVDPAHIVTLSPALAVAAGSMARAHRKPAN